MNIFKKKEKFILPHDLLYGLYCNIMKRHNSRKVKRRKYRKEVTFLLGQETDLIFKAVDLSSESLKSLVDHFNITNIEFQKEIYICVIPWYDFKKKEFILTPM